MSESETNEQPSISSLKQDINGLRSLYQQSREEIDELRTENNDQAKRIAELEDKVQQQEDTGQLIERIQKNGASDYTAYAAVLIRTLRTRAESNTSRQAEMDAKSASFTLQHEVHRTNVYAVFEKAVDLVDDEDLLEYRKEPRSSKDNSRLFLDLTQGDLPAQVEGHDIRTEEAP